LEEKSAANSRLRLAPNVRLFLHIPAAVNISFSTL
jgi:hypothetical protein